MKWIVRPFKVIGGHRRSCQSQKRKWRHKIMGCYGNTTKAGNLSISKKSFYCIGRHCRTLLKCNLWSLDFSPFYQKIRIYAPEILRPSHDVKSYFFPCKSQKLLQFGILEARWYKKMPFSSSFSYSLEHFRALWRHHSWRMTPASASAPSSSSSNVRKLMEVFFWKTDSFLYLTQRKTQSQLFLKR